MKIKINGNNENITNIAKLDELLVYKKLIPANVIIEHNLRIVPKNEWAKTVLNENDTIEIVSFVGGG